MSHNAMLNVSKPECVISFVISFFHKMDFAELDDQPRNKRRGQDRRKKKKKSKKKKPRDEPPVKKHKALETTEPIDVTGDDTDEEAKKVVFTTFTNTRINCTLTLADN